MRLGFLGRAGPPDDRLCLRKSDLGKNRFYLTLNMPSPNCKIIGTERIQTFIGYSGWTITLQSSLDTLAS